MEFNETCYSWLENTPVQKKYLLESDCCGGARRIYVCNIKTWFTPEDFKEYLRNYNFVKREKR